MNEKSDKNSAEVLLTGATGFLGSHVLEQMLRSGHRVAILKRSSSPLKKIAHLKNSFSTYNVDQVSLDEIFSQNTFVSIIHTATEYGRDGNKEKIAETNLQFPLRLLDAAVKYGVKRFLNTDTYFTKPDQTYTFLSDYTLSKKNLREELQKRSSQIQISNLILEHVFGPRDHEAKFIEKMIRDIAFRQVPSVDLTSGQQKRDFIYVEDVARAYMAVLKYSQTTVFQDYAVGTGNSTELRNMVETIARLSGSPTRLNFGALPQRPDEIMDSFADLKNLHAAAWRAQTSLTSGVEKTLAYYRQHPEFLEGI